VGDLLTAEENFDTYVTDAIDRIADGSIQAIHKRCGLRNRYGWVGFHDRFDVANEPNEPLWFGWVLEVDPYDPRSVPIKRTALGRAKHEAATLVIANGGQAVVYSGDDGQLEYVYKFVSSGRYNPTNRTANMGLLDASTLYVAKFRDDGTGEWRRAGGRSLWARIYPG
jgi:secreted PhoX family phosphatase